MLSINWPVIGAILGVNAAVVAVMHLIAKRTSSDEAMLDAGCSEDYVKRSRKLRDRRNNIGAISFFAPLTLGILICLIVGIEITFDLYYRYILIGTIIVAWIGVMLYTFFFSGAENAALKEIARESHAEIAVDFQHRALKMLVNLPLESISTILMVYFNVRFFNDDPVIFIYAFIVWFIFLIQRQARNHTVATMRLNYRIVFAAMLFFQFLKAFLIVASLDTELGFDFSALGTLNLGLLVILFGVIAGGALAGLINFPKVRNMFPAAAVSLENAAGE